MHGNQYLTLENWKSKYPDYFKNCKVLELGSLNASGYGPEGPTGTVRIYFENCEYIGIDKQEGKDICVDIVVEAKHTKFEPEYFDTLISFSMFEHDPEWKESLAHNMQWIRPGGMLFFTFGAEGNNPHYCGGFHVEVPHQEFLSCLRDMNIEIIDWFWENDRYEEKQCPGCMCIICKK